MGGAWRLDIHGVTQVLRRLIPETSPADLRLLVILLHEVGRSYSGWISVDELLAVSAASGPDHPDKPTTPPVRSRHSSYKCCVGVKI